MQWKSSSPGWRGVSYSVVESSGNVLIEVSGVWGVGQRGVGQFMHSGVDGDGVFVPGGKEGIFISWL